MDYLLITAITLTVFLLGYGIGRRIGKGEGYRQGQALIPLELRRLALENGRCPTCSAKALGQYESIQDP